MELEEYENKIECDECGSEYLSHTSKMTSLCPECSHVFYGYENFEHKFKNNRCEKCLWNGYTPMYLKNNQ